MRKPPVAETDPFDNERVEAFKACAALRTQISKLYVPHTVIENGFTEVDTRRPNPRIRGLVNVGSEDRPAIRAARRNATLHQLDRFTAVIRPVDNRAGTYQAYTSLAEIDFDSPLAVEGYTLRLHPAIRLTNPVDFTPKGLYGALWEWPEPSDGLQQGYVGFDYTSTGTGPELAHGLTAELAKFTSRHTLAGIGAVVAHVLFSGGEA